MAATRLADVGARNPQPLVLGGRGQHAPQQLAVARLQLALRLQFQARSGDPLRERIAHPLELLETGNTRRMEAGRNGGVENQPRKRLGVEARKLVFEPGDLAP